MNEAINDENSAPWLSKIALVSATEYIRSNLNKNDCGNFNINTQNISTCINTNWMFDSNINWWTTSVLNGGSYAAPYIVTAQGHCYAGDYGLKTTQGIKPSIYLSSKVQITGGTGTQSDPYTIE